MKLIDIEKQVLKKVVEPWQKQVNKARDLIFVLYTPYMGRELSPAEEQYVINQIVMILDRIVVDPNMDQILLQYLIRAHNYGLESVAGDIGVAVSVLPVTAPLDEDSQRVAEGMAERSQDAIRQVKDNLKRPGAVANFESMMESLTPMTKNSVKVQQGVTWSMNNASNSAISGVADSMGLTKTWVPERDGCVHCTAYAGVDAVNGAWDKGLTFGKKPLKFKGRLTNPPLHPNCRCDIAVGLSEEYKRALRREAIRSVLRGTRMPSESERVRLEAAERLLRKDPVAPESVKKYARDAIKRDGFTPKKRT